MIEKLKEIDDRLILVTLTLLVLIAFAATRDPLFGDMAKYLVGATAGIMVARMQKTLTVTGDMETAKTMAKQFLDGQ